MSNNKAEFIARLRALADFLERKSNTLRCQRVERGETTGLQMGMPRELSQSTLC